MPFLSFIKRWRHLLTGGNTPGEQGTRPGEFLDMRASRSPEDARKPDANLRSQNSKHVRHGSEQANTDVRESIGEDSQGEDKEQLDVQLVPADRACSMVDLG